MNSFIDSYANVIKELSYNCFINLSEEFKQEFNNYEDYKQNKKDLPIKTLSDNYTPRDLYILFSGFLKSIFGKEIFSIYLKNKILNDINSDILIIDDWRLPEDTSVFENEFNLIKVHLSKENNISKNLSNISTSYENKITPEICDIVFKFNEDWSNTEELIELIIKNVIT